MSSSLTGTLPPTSPVFPPCGTIPILFSLQYFTILLTSSVVRGLSTVVDFPLYFPIQSSLNGFSSSAGVFDGEKVDRMEEGARKLEKCVKSSSVTEFRFDDTVVEAHLWYSEPECVLHAGARAKTPRRATAESMIDFEEESEDYVIDRWPFRHEAHQRLPCRHPIRQPTFPISRWTRPVQDPQRLHANARDGRTARRRIL